MSKRTRKVIQRQQRNAEQQDTRLPTRRPTSSYVKRLMMEYHEKYVLPLAADARASGMLLGGLAKLLLDKGVILEAELAEAISDSTAVGTQERLVTQPSDDQSGGSLSGAQETGQGESLG